MPEHSHEFHLYRVTVHPTREPLLATGARLDNKAELLRSALLERPDAPWGRTRWAIGNTSEVGAEAVYFRIWRAGTVLVAQTDQSGNVVERELEAAPNTHVLLDVGLQVCAIARAPKLAAETDSIARGLERLLNATQALKERFAEAEVSPIKDPQEFIEKLRRAYRTDVLWIEERRPNPIDVTGLAKNLSAAVESLRADKVRAKWTGENLETSSPEVEELIRTTNVAGGNAGARIQEQEHSRGTIAISLESRFAKVRVTADLDAEEGRRSLLSVVHEMYRRLRDRG